MNASQPARLETPQEWARRVLAEHGPPPQRVLDAITRARAAAERNLAQQHTKAPA